LKLKRKILFLPGILIALALACNLPTPTRSLPVEVGATLTSMASLQSAVPNPPEILQDLPITATLTPTGTPTPAPNIPMVSVSLDTNCRTGPGMAYDYLDGLRVGEKAEVVGKYTAVAPGYWIIKKGAITCWLWGQYATVEGDVSGLPEIAPPPSPTPSPTATATATPTTPPLVGDLSIVKIYMTTKYEIVAQIRTNPIGSLSGSFQYKVFANGSQVAQGTCAVPTGDIACYTGYKVVGSKTIRIEIDTNNSIQEIDESNNFFIETCSQSPFVCA